MADTKKPTDKSKDKDKDVDDQKVIEENMNLIAKKIMEIKKNPYLSQERIVRELLKHKVERKCPICMGTVNYPISCMKRGPSTWPLHVDIKCNICRSTVLVPIPDLCYTKQDEMTFA